MNLESALKYLKAGFSIIPVKPADKRPYIGWKRYQEVPATEQQVKDWHEEFPNAMIGILTGRISNLNIIDVDTEAGLENLTEILPEGLNIPIVKSPKGWHYWFKYQEGLSNAARVPGLKDCDIRTDGGYIIAPPSINLSGDKYLWQHPSNNLINIPKNLYEVLKSPPIQLNENVSQNEALMTEGRRDDDIFRLCNTLMRGNMPEAEVRKYALIFAKECGFASEEAMIKVNSAMKRDEQRGSGIIMEDVKSWILDQKIGSFSNADLYNSLQMSTRKEKQTLSKVLTRLCDDKNPTIERKSGRAGVFEILEPLDDCLMDWKAAEGDTVDLFLPFGLHEMVETYPGNIIVVAGESNSGKALKNDTPVLTTEGWVDISKLTLGHTIFGRNGDQEQILGIYPQRGLRECFRFHFNDRTFIDSDKDHIWSLQTGYQYAQKKTGRGGENKTYKKWINMTTDEIIKRYGLGKIKISKKPKIPANDPIYFNRQKVEIDPYILGALLGDGGLTRGGVDIHCPDKAIIKRFTDAGYKLTKYDDVSSRIKCRSENVKVVGYTRKSGVKIPGFSKFIDIPPDQFRLKTHLKTLGLFGCHSYEKFIPKHYLFNSIETRTEILKGLMDTDGYVSEDGKSIEYCSSSLRLAEDVQFLVRSLGGKAVVTISQSHYRKDGIKIICRDKHRVFIKINTPIFYLPRKLERQKPFVTTGEKILVSIEAVGCHETTCIKTSAEDGLFIAKDFIVTHNTAFMLNILKDNMNVFDTHYFNSEMGSIELKKRLEKFETHSFDDWKFSAYERSSNFHRVIKSGEGVLNIIDFLEIYDNFFQVGQRIKEIHDRLDGAIAIIGIQKERNSSYGRGGAFGMEKPRLYLNMGNGEIEIVKAKNWVEPDQNPNGCKLKFKLVQGHNFIQEGRGWTKETE